MIQPFFAMDATNLFLLHSESITADAAGTSSALLAPPKQQLYLKLVTMKVFVFVISVSSAKGWKR